MLFALIISCTQESKKPVVADLSGSWQSCLNGGYVEYHFTENHVIGFLEDALSIAYVFPYSTFKDTLVIYNDAMKQFFSSKFDLSNNKMTFYNTDDTQSVFIQFSEYSVFPLEGCDLYGKRLDSIAVKHYEYMFNKRKEDFVCESNSSVIQIHPDSIDMNLEDPPILNDL